MHPSSLSQKSIPLEAFHIQHQAKMGAFASYNMPLAYEYGSSREHLHTRSQCSLFDISHMGQVVIHGKESQQFIEHLLPLAVVDMPHGSCKYTVLLNEAGGIIDDVIVTRRDQTTFGIVVNAGCTAKDMAHITRESKNFSVTVGMDANTVLLALQGPEAESVLKKYFPLVQDLLFMTGCRASYGQEDIWINRCGYTGEDGFELSLSVGVAEGFISELLDDTRVQCAGLIARDTLRLEAGFLLYGNDIDENINPVEANVKFAIAKKRRQTDNDQAGFIGREKVLQAFEDEPQKIRVGMVVVQKVPIRSGAQVYDVPGEHEKNCIGYVSSGAITPSTKQSICMAYVMPKYKAVGTEVWVERREKYYKCVVRALPFVSGKYKK